MTGLPLLLLSIAQCGTTYLRSAPPAFEAFFRDSGLGSNVTGRLLLVLSPNMTEAAPEPRLSVTKNLDSTAAVFGLDLHGAPVGAPVVFDPALGPDALVGYPLRTLAELPPGRYRAQVVLHPYERYTRADGKRPWLPSFSAFEYGHDQVKRMPDTRLTQAQPSPTRAQRVPSTPNTCPLPTQLIPLVFPALAQHMSNACLTHAQRMSDTDLTHASVCPRNAYRRS